MKSKKKIDHAVEAIAKQNVAVNRAIDGMVEHVSSQKDADLRSDWEEIQRTSEMIVVQDLVFGQSEIEESSPMPKPNRKPEEQKSEHEGQNG
jgi:hypothetical protein